MEIDKLHEESGKPWEEVELECINTLLTRKLSEGKLPVVAKADVARAVEKLRKGYNKLAIDEPAEAGSLIGTALYDLSRLTGGAE